MEHKVLKLSLGFSLMQIIKVIYIVRKLYTLFRFALRLKLHHSCTLTEAEVANFRLCRKCSINMYTPLKKGE